MTDTDPADDPADHPADHPANETASETGNEAGPTDDEELRTWLRAADPAASGVALPSIDPDSLEALMTEISSIPPGGGPVAHPAAAGTGARRRPPSWVFGPAAAAAAVLLLVVLVSGGIWWAGRADDPPATAASPGSSPGWATITLQDAVQDPSASCMRPEPALMATTVDLAIAGTVREAGPASASIWVDRWYRGGGGQAMVVVRRPADSAPGILYAPELTVGTRVLVVATDGAVGLCDPSGPWSAEGEALYVAAFGAGSPAS